MRKQLGMYTAVVVAVVVAAAFAGPAFAGGKLGGGGTSSIALSGTASFGQPATFTVVDPPVKGLPEMTVQCSQAGQEVYAGTQMMSGASPFAPSFTLYSAVWAANGGGSADCNATLFYYTWQGQRETGVVIMARDSFTANG